MPLIEMVDEWVTARQYLATLLSTAGHELLTTEDGTAGLLLAARREPELIICDPLLRHPDGLELIHGLRANPVTASIPVLFYTAKRFELEARSIASVEGVGGVVTKPQSADELMAAVAAVVGGKTTAPVIAGLSEPTDPIDPAATAFIVDDDDDTRRMVSVMIDNAGVSTEVYRDAESFLERYDDRPGCLVLDLTLPGMPGIELLESLRARRQLIPVVILTGRDDLPAARRAVRLSVVDFLQKPFDRRQLLLRVFYGLQADSIRRATSVEVDQVRRRMASLTDRERNLLSLVVEGRPSKQIAADLHISIRTVANHRSNLMSKTGAVNVADLVRMTMLAGRW